MSLNLNALARRILNATCAAALLLTAATQPAFGAIVSTETARALESRDLVLNRVQTSLARENVTAAMQRLGADPLTVSERVALLSDAELAQLDGQLQSLPAGAGVIEVVGIVFLVLLILELVGVIDIFTAI